jgi:hypothetical protein
MFTTSSVVLSIKTNINKKVEFYEGSTGVSFLNWSWVRIRTSNPRDEKSIL